MTSGYGIFQRGRLTTNKKPTRRASTILKRNNSVGILICCCIVFLYQLMQIKLHTATRTSKYARNGSDI